MHDLLFRTADGTCTVELKKVLETTHPTRDQWNDLTECLATEGDSKESL